MNLSKPALLAAILLPVISNAAAVIEFKTDLTLMYLLMVVQPTPGHVLILKLME